jgi:hypothetical protein
MRRETAKEREAWTALVECRPEKKGPKFQNTDRRKEGGYQSNKEAAAAVNLDALHRAGKIRKLREQVPVVLVKGRDGLKDVIWIADFVYEDLDGKLHYLDVKGFKNRHYLLKKKLAYLLCGITIEEL